MATLRLRDRDAIITKEGLIFRVFGYSHPSNAYVCDAEYAPAEIFKSDDPKAFRTNGKHVFYKFYEDEGWNFIKNNFPQYMIFHEALGKKVLGVKCSNIVEVRKPNEELRKLIEKEPKDELLAAIQNVLEIAIKNSGLASKNFGVFGSLLHGLYHPKFSDIDLIIYGRENTVKLCETLQESYRDRHFLLRNEFESDESIKGKHWRFQNYSFEEFAWHQQRKMIYAVFHDRASRRVVKVEFEPVKEWDEISSEYGKTRRVIWEGWVKAVARVRDDEDVSFMPSIYPIDILEVTYGPEVADIRRIISYIEEFRMQAWKDEVIYVEGNLEKVETSRGELHQITLTYGPRYYEQVLKSIRQE